MSKRTPYIFLLLIALGGTDPVRAQEQAPAAPEPLQPETAVVEPPIVSRNPFVPQLPYELIAPEITDASTDEPLGGPETTDFADAPPPSGDMPAPIEEKKPIQGTPTLNISGILWNSDRPQAIVNGNIIEIGDKMFGIPTDKGELIAQIEIVAIDKNGVSVAFEDRTVTVNSGLQPPKGAAQ